MSEDASIVPVERVEQAIYLIRGQKVMLDRDLATLYDVETRVLNQAVGRNEKRFPSDFMFELTREEIMRISQNVTSSETPDIKYSKRVFAFTEQGVAMLSAKKEDMKTEYFHDSDTLLIKPSNNGIVETRDIDENILGEYDSEGHLVSITIEHAKELIT